MTARIPDEPELEHDGRAFRSFRQYKRGKAEETCSGFPHSVACVKAALDTGEPLCMPPESTSSPTVVEGGRVVVEPSLIVCDRQPQSPHLFTSYCHNARVPPQGADPEMAFAEALTNYGRDPETVAMKKAVVNLLRAGHIVGLDPREMVAEALAEIERTDG